MKRGSAALEQRVAELQLLHETAARLTSLLDVRELLPEMVEQLRHVLDVEIVSIMLLSEDGRDLHIAAAAGLPPDIVETARVPIGEGISGQVAARGEAVLVRDMSEGGEFGHSPYRDQYTTESLICAPLKAGDRVRGVINVNNKLGGAPLDEHDLQLVTTFSAQAVLALENSRLYGDLEGEVQAVTAELKLSNDELRRMQEFNESILSHMGSGLLVLDRDGRVTKINRSAAELLGLPGELPPDETLATLFGDHGAEWVLQESKDGGRRETIADSRYGRQLLVGFSTSPLLSAAEQVMGTIVVFRDLTELKQMEAELIRMDRIASLGILGAGIAHEIRNPLAAIRFNLDFLKSEGQGGSELEVIVKNVERIDDLVKKLLRFARPQRPSVRAQPLANPVQAVAALLGKQAEAEGKRLELELAEDLPDVQVDASQVEQVILNVALNGLQMMQAGGRLVFRTRLSPPREGTSSRQAQILISDDGPGLSPEQARKVFDPFFTTREDGTGLGLAVAHRIMQDHGGSISALTERVGDERGATFVISFPLVADRATG